MIHRSNYKIKWQHNFCSYCFFFFINCLIHYWRLLTGLQLQKLLCCSYFKGSWSYGSWIYNYLCNQCLSPLKIVSSNWFMARCTRYNISGDKVCQWLATGRWFFPGIPIFPANKTDRHDITEISLKVVFNTINHKPPTLLKT